jgi:hypothetical protein
MNKYPTRKVSDHVNAKSERLRAAGAFREIPMRGFLVPSETDGTEYVVAVITMPDGTPITATCTCDHSRQSPFAHHNVHHLCSYAEGAMREVEAEFVAEEAVAA